MFEVEAERDDELGDDVAEEGGGEVERDHPDGRHGGEDDLFDVSVAVEYRQVNVGDQEADGEADEPRHEHSYGDLLRAVPNPVAVLHEVLTNTG